MAGERVPPQPHQSGLTDFLNHPLVVAVVPGQPALVALAALSLARAIDAPALYFAYVDTSRYAEDEYADGTVRHLAIDPGLADDTWMDTEQHLKGEIAQVMSGQDVPWEFRYLGGRIDRALSHLARAVDAAAFVVGARVGHHRRISDFMNGSVSANLAHRQHRPVLLVPLEVVDWKGRAPWE